MLKNLDSKIFSWNPFLAKTTVKGNCEIFQGRFYVKTLLANLSFKNVHFDNLQVTNVEFVHIRMPRSLHALHIPWIHLSPHWCPIWVPFKSHLSPIWVPIESHLSPIWVSFELLRIISWLRISIYWVLLFLCLFPTSHTDSTNGVSLRYLRIKTQIQKRPRPCSVPYTRFRDFAQLVAKLRFFMKFWKLKLLFSYF